MIAEMTRLIAERMKLPAGYAASANNLSGSTEAPSTAVFFEDDRPLPDHVTENLVRVAIDPVGSEYGDARTVGAAVDAAFIEYIPVIATVYGVSNKDGATTTDHRRACNEVSDAFLIELQAVAHSRKNPIRNIRAKLLPKDEGTEREWGARLQLTFQIGRAILRKPQPVASGGLIAKESTKVDVWGSVAMQGNPTLSAQAPANTYMRSSGSFVADGFTPGQKMTVAGMTQPTNNGMKTVTLVTASTLTVAETLVAEAGPAAGVTITTLEQSC